MQTVTTNTTTADCTETTDVDALNTALEAIQGQGALITRRSRTLLNVDADGPEMLEFALAFIKAWIAKDAKTMPPGVVLAPGDAVTHRIHTDAKAAEVISVSASGKTARVRYCKQELANGPTSGHPEALICTPGGFCGHVEGRQIWNVTSDPNGFVAKFTLRKHGPFWTWKLAGSATRGPGNVLTKGHHPHYDFNF